MDDAIYVTRTALRLLDATAYACYTGHQGQLSSYPATYRNSAEKGIRAMTGTVILSIRQNHALEHATISTLIKRVGLNVRMVGCAVHDGFYLYGDVPTEDVRDSATEALERLQQGERDLAVSPFCGTNLVVAGIMAGIASLLVLGGSDRRKRLLPVIIATTWAIVASRPVGRAVQKYITTTSNLSGVRIKRITRRGVGARILHKVETTRA